MSDHLAVISIGTNSTRVLLADVRDDRAHIALGRSIGTRLGESLGENGALGDEPMERTLEAIRVHLRAVRGHYLKLFTIATSAVRRASNRDAFGNAVERIAGVPLRVLSGEEEATASYRGAISSLPEEHDAVTGVVDVGGGSTEYAVGTGKLPERTLSLEIGAVRLTEALPQLAGANGFVDAESLAQAGSIARERLAPLREMGAATRVVLVGGSATGAATMLRGRRTRFDHFEVSRSDLQRSLIRLCTLDIDGRRRIEGVKAQRADILPAGIIVLETVLELLGQERATVSSADLLLGFLLEQQDAMASARHSNVAGRWWNR